MVIYPNRQTEQHNTTPYQALLNSSQIHRLYSDELELGTAPSFPGQLIQLTVTRTEDVKEIAQNIIKQVKQYPPPTEQAIISLTITIIAYKFTQLSRQEVEEMLGFTTSELEKSRFYQEVKEEELQEGERLLIVRHLSQRLGELDPGLVAA